MSRVFRYFCGWRGILLSLYLWLVFGIQTFLRLYDQSDRVVLSGCILAVVPAAVLAPLVIRLCSGVKLKSRARSLVRRDRLTCFFLFSALALLILMIYYKAYYPGAFTPDSINQYKEVVTGEYDNWHPVLQTLFAFGLPTLLFFRWIGGIVLFQILCLSFTIGYACYTLAEYGNTVYAAVSFAFIMLNPVTGNIAVMPWKDVSFAIAAVLCASFALRVYYTHGAWAYSRRNVVMLVIALVCATLFRHNGMFFSIPMGIGVLLLVDKKHKIILAASVLATVVAITGPLYALMGVEKHSNSTSEALGVPVTVVAEMAAHDPSAMDDEVRDFIYAVADQNTWENYYVTGNFNSVKFYPTTDYGVIDEYGPLKVVDYMFRAFAASPKGSFRALFMLTDMVYGLDTDIDWDIYPYTADNDYGIAYAGDFDLMTRLYDYSVVSRSVFRHLFWYLGVINLALIAFILAGFHIKSVDSWKRLMIAGSALTYNFATMLLLCGSDFRFFYYSYPVFPLLLLLILKERPVKSV